eukprot:6026797-Amphidinium_carterae.1
MEGKSRSRPLGEIGLAPTPRHTTPTEWLRAFTRVALVFRSWTRSMVKIKAAVWLHCLQQLFGHAQQKHCTQVQGGARGGPGAKAQVASGSDETSGMPGRLICYRRWSPKERADNNTTSKEDCNNRVLPRLKPHSAGDLALRQWYRRRELQCCYIRVYKNYQEVHCGEWTTDYDLQSDSEPAIIDLLNEVMKQ